MRWATQQGKRSLDEIAEAIEKERGSDAPLKKEGIYVMSPKNYIAVTNPLLGLINKGYASSAYSSEYLERWERDIGDLRKFVPLKNKKKEPVAFMGRGLLGYTVPGWGFFVARDDLFGEIAEEVDVHEAIHTTNEYDTRRLTKDIMTIVPFEYEKRSNATRQRNPLYKT